MHYTAEDASKSFHIVHARRSENMPPPPMQAKLHPAALNNSVMDNMLHKTLEDGFEVHRVETLEEASHFEESFVCIIILIGCID